MGPREVRKSDEHAWEGEADMARFDISDCNQAALGASAGGDRFFDLGLMYSTGRSVPIDYVTAHKWFNLAAMNGNKDAIRLRREIAAEMTSDEIAAAQRAARDWMRMGGARSAA
jgi:TPR repeat protein